MEWVNLKESNLESANLTKVSLSEAYLIRAYFGWANLKQSNLRGSINHSTIFSSTLFSDTNFAKAEIGYTIFSNVDLGQCKNIDDCIHALPAFIDFTTIYKSKGNIPLRFLRGCGVSDNLIEYMNSLTGNAFDFYTSFISYSTADQEFASRLYADLQSNGVRCWYAPEDLKIGDELEPTIEHAIRIRDKIVLILSENSINRAWVKKEVSVGLDEEKAKGCAVLFPIMLDDSIFGTTEQWAFDLRKRFIGNFCNRKDHDAYKKSFDRLLRDLKVENGYGCFT